MAQVFGKIHRINDIQEISANFRKREIVIETDEQYKQHILIELQHDNVYLVENFNVGSLVAVSINLKGRVWTNPQGEDKYFNTIVGWKIEVAPSELNKPAPVPAPIPSTAFSPSTNSTEEDPDDLPF